MEGIEAQLQCKDVPVHASTGFGKTAVAAGPHVHEKMEGRVELWSRSLLPCKKNKHILDMLASRYTVSEYKLTATAVNSKHGGCTAEAMKVIAARKSYKKYHVLISPELAFSRFLSHWGSQFRKMYGTLGVLNAFIPKSVSVVAIKLQFNKAEAGYVTVDIGNNRSNVSIVVRAMQHAMSTYADLDFVIPSGVKAKDIPLTWIYADSILVSIEIEDHLMEISPANLKQAGLIRPYNAMYSTEYRKEVMRLVKLGVVRVLICTDATGMGCNIPNIEIIMQWKLPSSMLVGLAALLAEKTVYEVDLATLSKPPDKPKKGEKKGPKCKERSKKERTAYAILHGMKRGSRSGRNDTVMDAEEPPLDIESEDEGLKVFVQTGTCQLTALKLTTDTLASSPVPCCDICVPYLLNKTRRGPAPKFPCQSRLQKGEPHLPIQSSLYEWRTTIKKRGFLGALPLLSSLGPFPSEEYLGNLYENYGKELGSTCKLSIFPY
ncbi:hypothetical protein EDD85DRAFT_921055 [Armillaria nabsnona]|nr:hypothetical protein EDD85DRAFT_921055 [Armillaria nabsnona]